MRFFAFGASRVWLKIGKRIPISLLGSGRDRPHGLFRSRSALIRVRGLGPRLGPPAWTASVGRRRKRPAWTASLDLQLGPTAWTYSLDLQLGLTAWAYSVDLELGPTARTYSLDVQLGPTAWIYSWNYRSIYRAPGPGRCPHPKGINTGITQFMCHSRLELWADQQWHPPCI